MVTVVVGRDGNLVREFTGSDWPVEDVLKALREARQPPAEAGPLLRSQSDQRIDGRGAESRTDTGEQPRDSESQ